MKEALKQIDDLFETPDGPNTIEKQFKYFFNDFNDLPNSQ